MRGRARHPQTQGVVERSNRPTKDAILAFLVDPQMRLPGQSPNFKRGDWARLLPLIGHNHNQIPHTTTKLSTYQGFFGGRVHVIEYISAMEPHGVDFSKVASVGDLDSELVKIGVTSLSVRGGTSAISVS